jgi:hypothetical protein
MTGEYEYEPVTRCGDCGDPVKPDTADPAGRWSHADGTRQCQSRADGEARRARRRVAVQTWSSAGSTVLARDIQRECRLSQDVSEILAAMAVEKGLWQFETVTMLGRPGGMTDKTITHWRASHADNTGQCELARMSGS